MQPMTLRELVDAVYLNQRGFLRASRYQRTTIPPHYLDSTFDKLPSEYQRVILVLRNNLRLLADGKTYYLPIEGLRKCQIKTYSKAYMQRYGLSTWRHVLRGVGTKNVEDVLREFERFTK